MRKITGSRFENYDDLVDFLCEEGGFILGRCDPAKWGGPYSWSTKGAPDHYIAGYKTEKEAKAGFVKMSAGGVLGEVMLKLLKSQFSSKSGLLKPRKKSKASDTQISKNGSPIKTAEERGQELLSMKGKQLPTLACDFAAHYVKVHGLCTEVLLTAYTVYAQCVEKLRCTDPLYMASGLDEAWFKDRVSSPEAPAG